MLVSDCLYVTRGDQSLIFNSAASPPVRKLFVLININLLKQAQNGSNPLAFPRAAVCSPEPEREFAQKGDPCRTG